jgi:hypothetical protein
VTENSTIDYEDYDLFAKTNLGTSNITSPGVHSRIVSIPFVDYLNNDYRLLPNTEACIMSSIGSYVGSLPCVSCIDNNPIAIFSPSLDVGYRGVNISFNASYSQGCNSHNVIAFNWTFGDGSSSLGSNDDFSSHAFEGGDYSVNLIVADDANDRSSYSRQIHVITTSEPALYLYYPFDDDSLDYSGRNFSGSWLGNATYSKGINGKAISFFDNLSYVTYSEGPQDKKALTISVWAKKNNVNSIGYLLNKHVHYQLKLTNTGLNFAVGNDSLYSPVSILTNLTNNTLWHNYVMTYNGSTILVYIDGTEIKNGTLYGKVRSSGSWVLNIGKDSLGTANVFDGKIDEVKIYEKVLNSSEILKNYNSVLSLAGPVDCYDETQDDNETGVDCGGSCPDVCPIVCGSGLTLCSDGICKSSCGGDNGNGNNGGGGGGGGGTPSKPPVRNNISNNTIGNWINNLIGGGNNGNGTGNMSQTGNNGLNGNAKAAWSIIKENWKLIAGIVVLIVILLAMIVVLRSKGDGEEGRIRVIGGEKAFR